MSDKQSTPLTLKSLHLLAPDLAEDFAQNLEACVNDCAQRPSLPKYRELTMKLRIKPHVEDSEDCWIEGTVSRKTPAREIDPIRAIRTHDKQLRFEFSEEDM